MKLSKNNVGRTKSSGFQIGVRKTLAISSEKAWELLFSPQGLEIWLGINDSRQFLSKKDIVSKNKTKILLTTLREGSHVRMKWKPDIWENTSILQVRIIPNNHKTIISFHQEKLLDSDQRAEMAQIWKKKLQNLILFMETK